MKIKELVATDKPRWLEMRRQLWPNSPAEKHNFEINRILENPNTHRGLIAINDSGSSLGFAEIATREYVNGCEHSPVAFVEGIFVIPEFRKNGVATALVRTAVQWAKAKGIHELASDASIVNIQSQEFHRACGFVETEKVVYFKLNTGV